MSANTDTGGYIDMVRFFLGPEPHIIAVYRGFDLYLTVGGNWLALLPNGDFALFNKECQEALRWIDERRDAERREAM